MLEIYNRRYVGCKRKLLSDIYNTVEINFNKDSYRFVDLFAGTGSVGAFFLNKGKKVALNDNLYSNFIAYSAWFGSSGFSDLKIKKIIDSFNEIDATILDNNYFSKIYGDKYFSNSDAKKIGYIREQISDMRLKERERFILLTSLMYATDKIANTVGHFEHFLSKKPMGNHLRLEQLKIDKNKKAQIYLEDANKLARKIKSDVVYIDPPYNARQYINFYHVLENLMRWNKPMEFEGTSMKFKRNHLKSDYSKAKAPIVMKDLIENINAKMIIVSYNNTYSAKSTASNNKITEMQMEEILTTKGDLVEKKEINYKHFNSGKTNFKEHKEFLYVCKVAK